MNFMMKSEAFSRLVLQQGFAFLDTGAQYGVLGTAALDKIKRKRFRSTLASKANRCNAPGSMVYILAQAILAQGSNGARVLARVQVLVSYCEFDLTLCALGSRFGPRSLS